MKMSRRFALMAAAGILIAASGCGRHAQVRDNPRQFPGVALQDISFYSAALQRTVTYRVYRPANSGSRSRVWWKAS